MNNSPIFYMGNKERLIKNGLIDLFPKQIECMYDVFGGSGVVSCNTHANKFIINDIDKNLHQLYNMFLSNDAECLLRTIDLVITKYDLKEGIHKQGWHSKNPNLEYPTEEQNIRQSKYYKLREDYNLTKDVILLYVLTIFSNSHNMRFNSNGLFNMSIGNSGYCEHHKNEIKYFCDFLKNIDVEFTNLDFRQIKYVDNINDFYYFDPPYNGTLAIYNEQIGWTIKDDFDLFKICEDLNSNNIKFGISNIFKNNKITNQHLIDWCNKNNWNVFSFDKHSYHCCGMGNSEAKEVFICNY